MGGSDYNICMRNELHIQLHQGVNGAPDDILEGFPFGDGQSIIQFAEGLIVIDMADAEDTTTEQEWFLNGSEDVLSFYIVEDE